MVASATISAAATAGAARNGKLNVGLHQGDPLPRTGLAHELGLVEGVEPVGTFSVRR
jgi:hypothetical protein